MNNFVKLTIVLALISAAFGQSTTPTRIRSVTTLPATCQAGDGIKPADMVALVASGFSTPYVCGTTNNWFTPLQFSGIGTIPYYPANGITAKGDPNFTTDGSGNFQAVTGTFVGAGTAGFAGFGQGTVPTLTNTHTAYLYGATSIATSFGTTLPSSPGTVGQALVISTAPDATHITTGWSGVALLDSASDQTITGGNDLVNDVGGFTVTNTSATPSTSSLSAFVNSSGRGVLSFFGSAASSIFFDVDGGLVFNPNSSSSNKFTFNNAGVYFAGSSTTLAGGAISCAGAPHGSCSGVFNQATAFAGNTSGLTFLYAQDVASGAIGLPAASGTVSLATVENCGTTTTCAQTVLTNPIIVKGTVALSSGTPSTATLTSLPFTSTSSYVCTGTEQTTATNNLIKFANASASSTVITGPNTITDVIGYQCVGN